MYDYNIYNIYLYWCGPVWKVTEARAAVGAGNCDEDCFPVGWVSGS